MELGKRQSRNLEKARPTYAVDPVIDSLPIASVVFIRLQNPLDDRRGFRPARRVVWDPRGDQFLKTRLAARVGMIAANRDRKFGVLRIVDLHWRARRIAGAAADTFFLINL